MLSATIFVLTFLSLTMAELPKWARKRGPAASAVLPESKVNKTQERVFKEAEKAAEARTGKNKASKWDILEALIMIISRLCLSNANDLRELISTCWLTFLLPGNHLLVEASLRAGTEVQDSIQEHRKEKKQYMEALDKKMADKSDDDMDEEDLPAPPDDLVSPHLVIALAGMEAILNSEEAPASAIAKQAKQELQVAWDQYVKDRPHTEVAGAIHVFRCKRPQKTSKSSRSNPPNYAKLTVSLVEGLEIPLTKYLKASGGVLKQGKPPRAFLEREASTLLNRLQKK
jgi:hypothetical protein